MANPLMNSTAPPGPPVSGLDSSMPKAISAAGSTSRRTLTPAAASASLVVCGSFVATMATTLALEWSAPNALARACRRSLFMDAATAAECAAATARSPRRAFGSHSQAEGASLPSGAQKQGPPAGRRAPAPSCDSRRFVLLPGPGSAPAAASAVSSATRTAVMDTGPRHAADCDGGAGSAVFDPRLAAHPCSVPREAPPGTASLHPSPPSPVASISSSQLSGFASESLSITSTSAPALGAGTGSAPGSSPMSCASRPRNAALTPPDRRRAR
mmetsp:Transcript_13870/g.52785  ORF Transcript_13870/g.52785 Transcript_13870/m.52785 type:complete len:271 (+) Transcript_13870:684-1496(+)